MKLVVQIPCLDEEKTLPETLAAIPRRIEGIDEVAVLVIDDGSLDRTSEVARAHGADHILRFPRHKGLAYGFMAGLDASLKLGADIIVNTDADNQYPGDADPRPDRPHPAGRGRPRDRRPGRGPGRSISPGRSAGFRRSAPGWCARSRTPRCPTPPAAFGP